MESLKIIPFGNISREAINAIAEELQFSFKILSDIDEPAGLPKEFFNVFRHQFLADKILNYLSSRFRGKVLAITDEDIYSGDLNFIFGQAELPGDVAIVSIHRLDPSFYKKTPDKNLLIERAVKEAVHEIGHMFGLKHCDNPDCVMSFSNTIFDVDRKSKHLCDKCKNKLSD